FFGGPGSLFPTCSDNNGNGTVGEVGTSTTSSSQFNDNCNNTIGNGTAQLTVPSAGNNLQTVIAPFSCVQNPLATSLVMLRPINQKQGSFPFNVSCKGQATASQTSLSANPSTVEIIPARSNTSHSLILMKVLTSTGTPIFPGTDVEFRVLPTSTAKCSI